MLNPAVLSKATKILSSKDPIGEVVRLIGLNDQLHRFLIAAQSFKEEGEARIDLNISTNYSDPEDKDKVVMVHVVALKEDGSISRVLESVSLEDFVSKLSNLTKSF